MSAIHQATQDITELFSRLVRVGPLVRATGPNDVTFWLELNVPCCVMVSVSPLSSDTSYVDALDEHLPESTSNICTCTVRTVTVDGHYFAAPYIAQLQPATWYTYHLHIIMDNASVALQLPFAHCFRTMDTFDPATQMKRPSLRLAYGSCRKYIASPTDALSGLGRWLRTHWEQRETVWPHLLLLIGDQIYADQPPEAMLQQNPHLRDGATTFEEFASLYSYVWTDDSDVRQALALLPSYLIFDDHEITNNWNVLPSWCASMVERGQEQVIIDGLVAYWVYQGWGNLARQRYINHPLLRIMQEAEQHREDIIEPLREVIRREVLGKQSGYWHYEIPVTPSIFVMNARAERTSLFTNAPDALYAPTRIVSNTQMTDLQEWMQQHDDMPTILVSSVPIILPPLIGLVEYIAGARLWYRRSGILRKIGLRLAQWQQRLATRMSFDHWPVYAQSWHEFVQVLARRTHDVVALSGDVHFSYSIEARASRGARLVQLVSTPLANRLEPRDKQLIVRQSLLTGIQYGGLSIRMLPMRQTQTNKRISRGMLFQDVIAFVTIKPDDAGKYTVEHEYLSVVEGELQPVGRTKI